MTTSVTHSCGHTIEHDADYSEWFADTLSRRVCRECFRAQYEASVAAAREASRELPALRNGSEKQIDWATKLRVELIRRHPSLRVLSKHITNARLWIDWRAQPAYLCRGAREMAIKAENFDLLSRALGAELGGWMSRNAEMNQAWSFKVAWDETMMFAFGIADDRVGLCHTVNWISAERDAFLAAVIEEFPQFDQRARAAFDRLIDDESAEAQRDLAAREKAEVDAREAKAAEERRRKAAEEAAAARSKAAAEALAARWQPFRAEMRKPLSWDVEDGYWTRRRNKRFEALGIDALERHGVEALRIVLALPSKAELKAAENASAERLLSVAHDAQALAELVGPSAARHMHVEAGLPKPVIKKKAGETQKAPHPLLRGGAGERRV